MPTGQRRGAAIDELTALAAANLENCQYHFLRFTGDNTVNISSDAADIAGAGILTNKPQNGEHATVVQGGRMPVVAGAAIDANALVTNNSSGRATAVLSGSNSLVRGMALEAAADDGDLIIVQQFQSPYVWPGLAI